MLNIAPVTIIVVNWNAGIVLRKCVLHVQNQTVKPARVIVVDNGSTDESLDELMGFDGIEIMKLNHNFGFARGNNLALKTVVTPYVALLNPDAFPEPDWLKNLLQSAHKHPNAASIGSLQLMNREAQTVDGIGDCYHISGMMWRSRYGKKLRAVDLIEKEIFSPCAAAALYRMDALKDVGFFEESFFCYCEDVDLGFRLRLSGYESWYQPAAVVEHIGSVTSGGRHSNFAVYHGHRNLMWVYFRNLPVLLLLLFMPLHLVITVLTFVKFSIRGQTNIIFKAKLDALRALPSVLEQRKNIQKTKKISLIKLLSILSYKK
jgi:GT2 family glycosyltransferase